MDDFSFLRDYILNEEYTIDMIVTKKVNMIEYALDTILYTHQPF